MNPILSIKNLSHRYTNKTGAVSVLNDVNLTVGSGQMVGLFGDSGSGKTTLLLNCGTMLRPSQGNVEIQGVSIYNVSPSERVKIRTHTIGYLFQTLQLIPYLTLHENLCLPSGSSQQAADNWLQQAGLTDWANHKPEALSQGQRQRGALGRALVHQPKLLIADEPTGNLDRKNSELVFQVLRTFADSGGAVLVASHDPIIETYADTCLTLQNGSLKEMAQTS